MLQNYSNIVLDHYRHPRNFGKLEKATHTASELNPLCGDEIVVYLQVENGIIKEMKYEARGCALLIASASAVSERIKKQEVRSKEDIEKMLRIKVSPAREICATLVLKTINKGLKNISA